MNRGSAKLYAGAGEVGVGGAPTDALLTMGVRVGSGREPEGGGGDADEAETDGDSEDARADVLIDSFRFLRIGSAPVLDGSAAFGSALKR